MRAILAALTFCVFTSLFAAPASAHPYRHYRVHPMVQAPGFGFAHMMASMRTVKHLDHARHHVAGRPSGHRHAEYRMRKFAQPRMEAAFLPFEPGAPFSFAFGAAQDAVDAGVAAIGIGSSVAADVAVGVASRVVEGVSRVIGYRPRDCAGIPWCGCYMRHLLGVSDRSYNLARNWAHYGRPTSPHVGAIVVWPHHVGKIVGQARNGEWIVLSGNDGHAVRERPRSLAGAIALRE